MKRGRKPAERSIVAGKRLKKAATTLGKNITNILDDQTWISTIGIGDEKTLRTWINKGMPENRIKAVADYFGLPRGYFTDTRITDIQFEQAILHAAEQPNGPIGKNSIAAQAPFPAESAASLSNSDTLKLRISEWFEQGCPYHALETLSKQFKIDPYITEPFTNQNDSQLQTFMLGCALHIGKNWDFWVKCNQNDKNALNFLVNMINTTRYIRPRLRALYALQKFPSDWIRPYLNDGYDPEWHDVIKTYVLKGNCLAYILQKKEHFPQKVTAVLKELIDLWGEKIPGFGLFGTAEKKHAEKPAIPQRDESSRAQAIRAIIIGETMAIMEKAQRYLDGKSSLEELQASTPLLTSISSEFVHLSKEQIVLYRRAVTLDMELRKSGNPNKAAKVIEVCKETLRSL